MNRCEKMKEQREEEEEEPIPNSDGLSELPDSLILHILGLLPTTDAVRTTILSKRWKNLWTTVPSLEFEDCKKNFIDGAVNSWRGIKISRFKLKVCSECMKFDDWVQFAVEKKVEELELKLSPGHILSWVMHHISSCSSLKFLKLSACDVEIHGNVQWHQLKRLEISLWGGLTQSAVNRVLCGSPLLEHLNLKIANNINNLSIHSTSLKELGISNSIYESYFEWRETEITIWAPNLETLSIHDMPYTKYSISSLASLTDVGLRIQPPRSDLLPFPANDFVGDMLNRILPTIKHVERVSMTDWCAKALADMREKLTIAPFPNAKLLRLRVCFEEYEQIIGVLEMFPQLRHLYLQPTDKTIGESCLDFDRNLPSSFLLQLREVDIHWTIDDNSIFPLIQILLKYARNLEALRFRFRRVGSWPVPLESVSMATDKLARMERSSPTQKLYVEEIS